MANDCTHQRFMLILNHQNILLLTDIKQGIDCISLTQNQTQINSQKMDQQCQQAQDSIQVIIRIKPGSDDETMVYNDSEIKLQKHTFAFDRIFPPQSQQQDLFNAVGKKLLVHTLQGYNSCIFVYGQTGSGKTYTMMGNQNGLMQRSFQELFSRLDRLQQSECIVTCSYYQLYNEQIIDLLDNRKDKKNLNVRQDVKKGMFVENLTEESAMQSEKLLECLNMGMKNRHIGETMMNRESSRSHSIFTISLAIKSEVDGKKVLKTPKLHFVDLAGSERQKMTMSSGERLKEAGNINKSLTTLGMVINALASDKSKTHIPYRDSKLTCLLKDSLGGNSKTFIVATISTSMLCFQETLSTLNFANRAKMVKVKALINEESLSTNLEQFKEEIRRLKQQIQKLKSQKRVSFEPAKGSDSVISKNNEELSHKFAQLSFKIQDLRSNMTTPNIENVMQLLQKRQTSMVDEGGMQEEGNQLLEYMSNNHELLKRIHGTMNDYTALREELKSVEFSRRMPLEDIKTPSKFERDQYEDLLVRREAEIKNLQERVVSLKENNLKKQTENREMRRKLTSIQDHSQSKEETVSRLQSEQQDLYRRYSELQLKYELTFQQKLKLQKTNTQQQLRLKQSKELYVYAQQKYQNQKLIRNKLESSLKDINKKMHVLQKEKKDVVDDYQSRVYEIEEKLLERERREEELKSQLEVLNQTVQFDQKKMKEYGDKIGQSNRIVQEAQKQKYQLGEKVTQIEHEKQCLINSYEDVLGQLRLKNRQLWNSEVILKQQFQKSQEKRSLIVEEYEGYQKKMREMVDRLEQELRGQSQLVKVANDNIETVRIDYQKTVYVLQTKVVDLEKCLDSNRTELELERNCMVLLQKRYTNQKEIWTRQSQKMVNDHQQMTQQLSTLTEQSQMKDKRLSQLQSHVASTKNLFQEHEQLKKTYKDVIKQNYKLKGEYISTSTNILSQSAKNQQLISKVAYYEQKFRLMSLEYNKVQEVSKKYKQKELNLLKKVQYYEESEKLKKLHSVSENQDVKGENFKNLQLQNSQLKESLIKMTKLYEGKVHNEKKEDYSKRMSLEHLKYELEQTEQKMKKKLQNLIRNWDHAKENSCSGMNVEQLFVCWQKIENQSRKKIEGINRSIKRQQKLKIQNGFIIKENTYLKERVQALQRQMNLSDLCQPRKHVKIDQQPVI